MTELATQLSEALLTAALCADELQSVVRNEQDRWPSPIGSGAAGGSTGTSGMERPILEDSSLCVLWRERRVHLGHTVAFRFLQRLSRCPNQYVDHLTLLHDVWENEELAVATIRSTVRGLRQKLTSGGMRELALAIRGHGSRYILDLL